MWLEVRTTVRSDILVMHSFLLPHPVLQKGERIFNERAIWVRPDNIASTASEWLVKLPKKLLKDAGCG
jgi:hypothetical protein